MDSEPVLNGGSGDLGIKIEYPEIDIEEENVNNYTTVERANVEQNEAIIHDPVYNLWTSKATSCLISQYKKYRSMVGQTTKFRSLRDMFETISVEMRKHGFFFSSQKCENKWRVLERKYKNLSLRERLKKPGRMKHYGHWEHKRALDEIFDETRKKVYLKESEYPSVGSSSAYAIILPKPDSELINNNQPLNGTIQKSVTYSDVSKNSGIIETNNDNSATTSNPQITKNIEPSSPEPISAYFEKFFKEMKKYFVAVEQNNERRHREKMAMRQSELEVQQRLLRLKEQKLDLERKKIIAVAQNIQLNMI